MVDKIALFNKCRKIVEDKGNTMKLSWKCKKDHIFEKTSEQIKLNKWCSLCPK